MQALGEEPIGGQASRFLDRFMWEFQSDFEQILDLGEAFDKAANGEQFVPEAVFTTLARSRGCNWTLGEARQNINSDCTGGASFIELLLAVSNKTCQEFFAPPDDIPPDVQAQLKAAVVDYVQVQEEAKQRADRVAKLQELVKRGGVKGFAAKSELAQLEAASQMEENRRRITGAAAKRMSNKIRQQYQAKRNQSKQMIQEAIDARLGALRQEEEQRRADLGAQFDTMFAAGDADVELSDDDEDEDEDSFDEADYPEIVAELGEEGEYQEAVAEIGEEYSSPASSAKVKSQANAIKEEAARVAAEEKERVAAEEEARVAAQAKEEEARVVAEEEEAERVAVQEARAAAEEEAASVAAEEEEEARIAAEEEDARIAAEEEARIAAEEEEEARIAAEEEARIAAEEEEARIAAEEEEEEARIAAEEEEEARIAAEEEAARIAAEEEARIAAEEEEEARIAAEEEARIAAEEEEARIAAEEEEARIAAEEEAARIAAEEEAARIAAEEEEEAREQAEYLRELEIAKRLQAEAEAAEQAAFEEELRNLEDAEAAEALALARAQEQILEEEARLAQLELEQEETALQEKEQQLINQTSQVDKELELLQQQEEMLKEQAERAAEDARLAEQKRIAEEERLAAQAEAEAEARLAEAEAVAAAEAARKQAEEEEEAARKQAEEEAVEEAAQKRAVEEAALAQAETLGNASPVVAAVQVDASSLVSAYDLKPWKSRSPPLPSGEKLEEMENALLSKVHHPKTWSSVFKSTLKKGDKAKITSLRRIISKSTANSILQKSYIVRSGNDSVPIQLNEALITKSLNGLKVFDEPPPIEKSKFKGTAHFLKGDCVDVAMWLRGSKKVNPVIVVSCDRSGTTRGDYPDGSCSQEDELCRRTALRAVLSQAGMRVPVGGALYVPEVPLIRDGPASGYSYLSDANSVSLICAAAVSADADRGDELTAEQKTELRSTIRTAFSAAILNKHDAIVFTAFGCGFSGCSPAQVAPIFADVVKQEFAKSFRHITFAILDDENGGKNFSQFQKAYVSATKSSKKKKKK